MVRTHRETQIRKMTDADLLHHFNIHSDRALDRLIVAMNNLHILTYPDKVPPEIKASVDYIIKCLDNVSAAAFAGREIHHRFLSHKKSSLKHKQYIREVLKKDVPEPEDIYLPNLLYGDALVS